MSSENIVLGECPRVTEAEVYVCLRGQMEDCVYFEFSKALKNINVLCDVAVEEGEVRTAF